jgi:soluble lytic murein transglycosylase-like protein
VIWRLRALLLGTLACAGVPAFAAERAVEVDPALLLRLAHTLAENHAEVDHFEAQVWLMASDRRLERYLHDPASRLDLLQVVYRESKRQLLDPDLVLAVMQVESAFDRFAISRVGAQGLMQIMPFWRDALGRPQDNLMLTDTNVQYGTTILAHYLEQARGDLIDALARYNGSRGRLDYPELVVSAWRKVWRNKPVSELPELVSGCSTYGLKACRFL